MQLQKQKDAFDKRSVGVIAVSVDSAQDLAKARSKSDAQFPFVSDRDGTLMDLFQLRHSGGHPFNGSDIARPASILIAQNGKVLWSTYAENYRVRPSVSQCLEAIDANFPSLENSKTTN